MVEIRFVIRANIAKLSKKWRKAQNNNDAIPCGLWPFQISWHKEIANGRTSRRKWFSSECMFLYYLINLSFVFCIARAYKPSFQLFSFSISIYRSYGTSWQNRTHHKMVRRRVIFKLSDIKRVVIIINYSFVCMLSKERKLCTIALL